MTCLIPIFFKFGTNGLLLFLPVYSNCSSYFSCQSCILLTSFTLPNRTYFSRSIVTLAHFHFFLCVFYICETIAHVYDSLVLVRHRCSKSGTFHRCILKAQFSWPEILSKKLEAKYHLKYRRLCVGYPIPKSRYAFNNNLYA